MRGSERVVHHTWSTIETLMDRLRRELPESYFAYLELLKTDLTDLSSTDTIYSYLNAAGIFLKYIIKEGKELENISARDIKMFLARYKSPQTRNVKLRAIRRLAKSTGIKTFIDAAYNVRFPKIKTGIPYIADKKAVEQLIEHARQPYKTVISIIYETGIRRSEALSLKYGDVEEWDYGYKLKIRHSKSQPRIVYIIIYQNTLREWLQQHRSKDPNDWLFYTSTGNPIRPSTLTVYIRKLAKNLGLDPDKLNLHPHAIRHLRATELYKSKKLSEKELMKLFGWKTRTMIDVYARIVQEDVEESLIQLYSLNNKNKKQEYIMCPRCGTPNPPDAKYCYKCGLPLTEDTIADKLREEQRRKHNMKLLARLLAEIPPQQLAALLEKLAQS